nr:sugar ABC transporter ATP-binding protein [Kineosporia babensis]
MPASVLRAESIVHDYSGVVVLREVDLAIRGGEIHALLGQNGSGKSTLIKVLTGALSPSSGQLSLDGQEVSFATPQASTSAGIAVVHQNYNLFPELSVEKNLLATASKVPRRRAALNAIDERSWRAKVQGVLDRLGVSVDAAVKVSELGPAERKFVEIARAMLSEPRFLILDEPTASLEPDAATQVLDLMRTLRAQGIGVVFVSHRLDEVLQAADRYSILRDGALVATGEVAGLTPSRLTELMIGQKAEQAAARASTPPGPLMLQLRKSSVGAGHFDVDLHAGQVVAVTGLVGSGAATVVSMVGGDVPLDGQAVRDGQSIRLRHVRDAQKAGIGFIPEDRKGRGVVLMQSCAVNMSLSSLARISRAGMVSARSLRQRAEHFRSRLQIKMGDVNAPISSLSGGNQQKVMVARLLAAQFQIMAVAEPSQGVDIGGRSQIHDLLREFVDGGGSVLLFSTDTDEVLALADTVYVFRHGEMIHHADREHLDEHSLAALVAGVHETV